MIAALFVEPDGVYADLPDVDLWDTTRDARRYVGPWPVVAHPPCARWCALAPMLEAIYGDGCRVGQDAGCFESALASVRTYGGVLEHPAYSLAWRRYGLPRPHRGGWTGSMLDEGWTAEVDQAAYGHPARKRTWLYAVGVDLPALDWSSPTVSRRVSSFGHGRRVLEHERVRPTLAAATPTAFRDVLLAMVATVRV